MIGLRKPFREKSDPKNWKNSNKTDYRRANCYQTTGEQLASSAAKHSLVRLALV